MWSENASAILMLGGIAVAVMVLMRASARGWVRTRGKHADPKQIQQEYPLSAGSRETALSDAPSELLRWQVEMHETARDLKAEIDSKLAALQALVILARAESERLESALRRAGDMGSGAPNEEPRDTLAAIESLADAAALDGSDPLTHLASRLPQPPGGAAADLFDDNRLIVEVVRLADLGLSPEDIARRLGRAVGDVELLLSLRPS